MDRQPDANPESIPLCALVDEVKRRGIVKLTVAVGGEITIEYRSAPKNDKAI